MEQMDISYSDDENNNNTEETIACRQARRMRYREVLNKVEEIKASGDTSGQTLTDIDAAFQELNNLNSECDIQERVKNPGEILLETKVISTASDVVLKSVKAIDVALTTYEPKEFSRKLITFVKQTNNVGLFNLIGHVDQIIPGKLKYNYLYGAYDLNNAPQPPPKKPCEKRSAVENFTKKQPENVTELVNDEKSIDEIVNFLFDVLWDEYNKQKRNFIKYYDYIVDTDDYSKTVENMFYFSFLVRNGRASITLENNEPCIKPIKESNAMATNMETLKNSQIFASITMKDWKQFRKPGYLQVRRRQMPGGGGGRRK